MKRLQKTLIVTALALMCALPAHAEGFGVGVNAGTLGVGVDFTAKLIPWLNLRTGLHGLRWDTEIEPADVKYDLELDSLTVPLVLDFHPANLPLRLSAGCMFTRSSIDLEATPTGTISVGGTDYTAEQVGTLKGEVDFKPLAPYVGVGWGNAAKDQLFVDLGLQIDLGVALQAAPDVDLTATGSLAGDNTFQEALARELDDLEEDMESFEYYPVISIGITYSF